MSRSTLTADEDHLEWFREFKRVDETNDEFLARVCAILEQRDGGVTVNSSESNAPSNQELMNRLDDLETILSNRMDDVETTVPTRTAEEISQF